MYGSWVLTSAHAICAHIHFDAYVSVAFTFTIMTDN